MTAYVFTHNPVDRLTGAMRPCFDILVCIYTCEQHQSLLSEFDRSILGQSLRALNNAKILAVYADAEIPRSSHAGNYTRR